MELISFPFFLSSSDNGFFKNPKIQQVIIEPNKIHPIYNKGLLLAIGITKIPPCGAFKEISSAIQMPPPIAAPIIFAGITLKGSAAANGMAPSVINN